MHVNNDARAKAQVRRWRIDPKSFQSPRQNELRGEPPTSRRRLRRVEAAQIAEKPFRIRIERAVAAVRQSSGSLSTKAACRAVGLAPQVDKIVARLCDDRGIARRRALAPLDPIKVQRAVFHVARNHGRCTVKAACSAIGFEGREARRAERLVATICDARGIARCRSLRVLLPHWTKTSAPAPAFVKPRPSPSSTRAGGASQATT